MALSILVPEPTDSDFEWTEDLDALSVTCVRGLADDEVVQRLGFHPMKRRQCYHLDADAARFADADRADSEEEFKFPGIDMTALVSTLGGAG